MYDVNLSREGVVIRVASESFLFFCFFVFLLYPPKCLKVGTGHIATRYNGRK